MPRRPNRRLLVAFTAALLGVALGAPTAFATPPDHAPAHGYRAKHGNTKARPAERERAEKHEQHEERQPRKGIEVVYDSERGVYVGVHLPDVFFHDGRYFRESGQGRWEVSASGDGDWKVAASSKVPDVVVKANAAPPGPAKAKSE